MTVNPGFGGQKFIRNSLKKMKELARIRDERGRIRSDAGVYVVAVVQRFGKCVDAAELQAATEAPIQIHFEPVV